MGAHARKSQLKRVAEPIADAFHEIASALYADASNHGVHEDDDRARLLREIMKGADSEEKLIVCQFFAEMTNIDPEPFWRLKRGRREAMGDYAWSQLRWLFCQLAPEGYEDSWIESRPCPGLDRSHVFIQAHFATVWVEKLGPILDLMSEMEERA